MQASMHAHAKQSSESLYAADCIIFMNVSECLHVRVCAVQALDCIPSRFSGL